MPDPDANLLDTKTAAALLDLSPRRLQQLAREGWCVPAKRGRWPLVSTVRGYIAFLKTGSTEDRRSSASTLHAWRAAEIERRMMIQDRTIIMIEEAESFVDRLSGDYLESIGGLPARITRDPRERQRIEAICDAERLRLSDQFAEAQAKLKAGRPIDNGEEDE